MLAELGNQVNLSLWRKVFLLLNRSSRRLSILGATSSIAEAGLGISALYLTKLNYGHANKAKTRKHSSH